MAKPLDGTVPYLPFFTGSESILMVHLVTDIVSTSCNKYTCTAQLLIFACSSAVEGLIVKICRVYLITVWIVYPKRESHLKQFVKCITTPNPTKPCHKENPLPTQPPPLSFSCISRHWGTCSKNNYLCNEGHLGKGQKACVRHWNPGDA